MTRPWPKASLSVDSVRRREGAAEDEALEDGSAKSVFEVTGGGRRLCFSWDGLGLNAMGWSGGLSTHEV